MKIQLEFPYSQDWSWGYIQTNRENRKHVYLYKVPTANSQAKRSTTQYARYLVAVKLGRYLSADETVDHIDEDKTNDDIHNLQLLSRRENSIKNLTATGTSKIMVECYCAGCNKLFSVRRGLSILDNAKINSLPYCSRNCSSLFANRNKQNKTIEEIQAKRKELFVREYQQPSMLS